MAICKGLFVVLFTICKSDKSKTETVGVEKEESKSPLISSPADQSRQHPGALCALCATVRGHTEQAIGGGHMQLFPISPSPHPLSGFPGVGATSDAGLKFRQIL